MITWILDTTRRWIFNRNRYIYRYWNGRKMVAGDPVILYRGLMLHDDYRGEIDFDMMKFDAKREEITIKLANVFRDVFSVLPPEEGGLTVLECLNELKAFVAFSGIQKKSTESTLTLPPLTGWEHSHDFHQETSTSDDLASCSTSNESKSGTESESPAE